MKISIRTFKKEVLNKKYGVRSIRKRKNNPLKKKKKQLRLLIKEIMNKLMMK
jgi:hypothetical protein